MFHSRCLVQMRPTKQPLSRFVVQHCLFSSLRDDKPLTATTNPVLHTNRSLDQIERPVVIRTVTTAAESFSLSGLELCSPASAVRLELCSKVVPLCPSRPSRSPEYLSSRQGCAAPSASCDILAFPSHGIGHVTLPNGRALVRLLRRHDGY